MKVIFKGKRGITLIALVITIIVLLILAGISISMLTGQNGILSRAGEAKEKTEYASLKEEVQMVLLGRKMTSGSGGANNKTLKEDLEQQIQNAEITESGAKDTCYVKRGNAEITAYEDGEIVDGKIEVWDGTSVTCPELKKENNIWHWYIYTPSQLKFLADFVNNGNSLTGTVDLTSIVTDAGYNTNDVVIEENKTTVYLMNDLDMGARPSSGTTEEQKWETTANETKKWTPIGIDKDTKKFIGIFEGNEKTIRNVYVNREEKFNAIFGNSNTIKNLSVKDSYFKGKNCTAGIVGALRTGTIENCHNINTIAILIAGENYIVGGVVGQLSTSANNLTNSGTVIAYGKSADGLFYAGGVIGNVVSGATLVTNCKNTGTVKGMTVGIDVGGVVGTLQRGEIRDCMNSGIVTSNGSQVGGIVATQQGKSIKVSKCKNTGKVTGKGNYVGGIAGGSYTIEECTNSGEVIGNGNGVGGIAGAGKIITKCANTGNVIADNGEFVGGIVGQDDKKDTKQEISICYNTGMVRSKLYAGGISGYFRAQGQAGTETKCYNKGKIIATEDSTKAGGIAGKLANDATVTKCFYLSNIGVEKGISEIDSPGDLDAQNAEAKSTDVDLKTFEEFLEWIEQQ